MVIEVNIQTILQKKTTKRNIRHLEVEFPLGRSLADLLILLDISPEPNLWLLGINGKYAGTNFEIINKDIVDIIPAISGGNEQTLLKEYDK